MKKAVLGMSAAALVAAAAWAQDAATDETKVAALDTSVAAFGKLDADGDGKVSAIEAANDTHVATGFTQADKDSDGYLSPEEFQAMGQSESMDSGMESQSSESASTESTASESEAPAAPQE